MLNHLKSEANIAYTENGAVTNASTMSDCLDLFAGIGALRAADDQEIIRRFVRAYAEDADIAMKILFFGRDVRGGLGERRVFRVIINWLAENRAESLRKNIELIPEFGRYDDLVSLIGTACEKDALRTIRKQLEADLASDAEVSLLAKWLPSVNASNAETVRKAKRIARYLGMSDAEYRKTLVELRKKIRIMRPNYLTEYFPKYIAKHGMPKMRFHDLRHSCASLLLANGVPLKQIQEWLGHSDFSTTANIYAHLDYRSKISSAQAMEQGMLLPRSDDFGSRWENVTEQGKITEPDLNPVFD